MLGRGAAAFGSAVAIQNQARIDGQAGAGQGGAIALFAQVVDRLGRGMPDKGDAAVALGNQMLGGNAGALEIVDPDKGHGAVGHRLVDRHHRGQAQGAVIGADAIGQVAGEQDEPVGLVGIDEAQFMGEHLIDVVNKLAYAGKRVILAGLDMDFRGKPFHPMPELMAIAEHVEKVHAICVVCNNPANFSQRVIPEEDLIAVGSTGMYEARCRLHFKKSSEK